MKIIWMPGAVADLNQIGEYINERNPAAAMRVVTDIRSAIERLEQFPQLGYVSQTGNVRLMQIPGRPYLIPYKIVEDRIRIISVFDERRERPENWE